MGSPPGLYTGTWVLNGLCTKRDSVTNSQVVIMMAHDHGMFVRPLYYQECNQLIDLSMVFSLKESNG